jgi:hypothetical protein
MEPCHLSSPALTREEDLAVSGQPSDKNSTIWQSSEDSDSRAQWLPVWMLELGEGNNRSAQTGCLLLLLLSRHTKRATMHAFLCIAQSRYHTSAVLHDAASCTPPGPSSLAPRHNRDRQRLEQPAQRRQTFCKWCCTGFFARSSGLPDPLESRRSSWVQVPQFILWLWSRTFETWFPGSATRRFLVTAPA